MKAAPNQIFVRWSSRAIAPTALLPRVLVVDDNEMAAEALATLLQLDGFETRYTFSGLEALREIRTWHPELVFLDINMPRHDGIRTARVLSRMRLLDGLALVAFTAFPADTLDKVAVAAGFDAYCQKRGDIAHIYDAIHALTCR
ncbi:MAG: response regulator [Janthinobacterium lividum]